MYIDTNTCTFHTQTQFPQYLTKYCQFIVWQQAVGFVHEEVSSDKLLKSPVLALYKPVCTLAFYTDINTTNVTQIEAIQ